MGSLTKSAHEMAIDGDEPPPRYIIDESTFGSIDLSPPLLPIPTIDISLLSLPSSGEEVQQLRSVLSSWGCFQIQLKQLKANGEEMEVLLSTMENFDNLFKAIGHGIPDSYLNKVREVAKQFFSLPVEEKKKYSHKDGEGYGGDLIVSEKQVLDWSDRLVLKVLPEDERRPNLWPEFPTEFREVLHEYAMKIKYVLDTLFKATAKSLNLEEDTFLSQFGDRACLFGRFNFYPPCPRPDQVLGLKPHSDRSGMTVLLQDKEVEGLHVLKDNHWFRVPIIPHALVVNVGDQMQIMTNGIIKSPIHRAVLNRNRLRISVTIANLAEPEKEIGPAEGLIDEKRPRLYRNVKNYAAINFECFQKGEVAINTIKI